MPLDDFETTTEAPDDIRSALMAALDGAEPAASPVEPAAIVEPDVTAPARARSPDGKFAAKESVEAPVVADPAAPVDPVAPPVTPEAPKATTAPANWAADDKAKFAALTPDGQEFLLRRHNAMEADYTRKTTEIAAFKRDYEPVAALFAPHMDALRTSGFTPATLVKAWTDVEQKLMGGHGVAVVSDIVRQYKINPQEIARALGLSAPAAGVERPPEVAATQASQLPPEIAAKLAGYDTFIAQQQQERAQTQATQQREAEQRVMSTIDQFRGAKDAAGSLAHPHFEEVESHMTRLIIAARTSGQAVPSLDELYDQAVWANPSTRAKAMEATRAAEQAQHAASEAARAKEARAKAERARRAGSSVTGSPGTGQSAAPATRGTSDSIRASLLAAAEEHEAA